jgi:hypothetical protein
VNSALLPEIAVRPIPLGVLLSRNSMGEEFSGYVPHGSLQGAGPCGAPRFVRAHFDARGIFSRSR